MALKGLLKLAPILHRQGIKSKYFAIWKSGFSSEVKYKKTPLYDFHVELEGKMVPFAGYSMPVQYGSFGIAASHLHTREHVSIFDVSHMLQSYIRGADAVSFMEELVVADVQSLNTNQGCLTLYINENGGIIDDLIVTKISDDHLYVVSNAGCAEKDLAHVQGHLKNYSGQAKLEIIEDKALLAIQGPSMPKVLQPLLDIDLSKLTFMTTTLATLCGVPNCRVTRCGYTGEDGVEISVPSNAAVEITKTLLKSTHGNVKMAGLGARDTLRLEAGLCLYGNDINDSTTPIEAGLAWTIGKRRRTEKGFPAVDIILEQLKRKPLRRRVGFVSSGPPARAHTPIMDLSGRVIGEVTSGCPSPSLKTNVAMGYIDSGSAAAGTNILFDIRKKRVEAQVIKMPFMPVKYYMGSSNK